MLRIIHFTYHQKLETIKVIPEDFAEHDSVEHLFAGGQLFSAGVGSLLVQVHPPSVGLACSSAVFGYPSVVAQWSHAGVGKQHIIISIIQ